MQLKSILCPVDFSDFSAAAYQYAMSLADYYKAKLVALHVVELWKYPFADYAAQEADFASFSRAMKDGGEQQLRQFTNKHLFAGIQPELVVRQGRASDCTLSFAERENMEAIVMGTHGRRGFDRLVLGSTTDRVLRRAACPVLVVSSPSHNLMTTGPEGRHRLSRILYCTDFSNNAERAREYALSLAAEYGAELTLLHVARDASEPARSDAIIAECTAGLDRLISENEHKSLHLRKVVRFGKPYEQIAQYAAETHPSLIILTARGNDAVDRAVFGSTTYRVIQLGPCPVLTIHT